MGSRKIAVAPLADGSGRNVTTPPSTGSTGLLAVTVTASGLAKAVPIFAVCGVLPGTIAKVKPWLSKAPMSTPPNRPNPRWSVAGIPDAVTARVDGRAAGQQGHGLGRPAVVAQGSQDGAERQGGGAGQVGADPAAAAVGLADQVVALRRDDSENVGRTSDE